MAEEEIVIEMAPQQPQRQLFKNRRFILALIAICLVLACALFSWWLSLGKISSASARLDALIYTVGPEYAAKLQNLFVQQNELVSAGQPLARISALDAPQTSAVDANLKENAQAMEKELTSRLGQAQAEEETARRLYQEAVSDHVRAQLAMRAINPANRGAYTEASEIEAQARRRMQSALEAYEKISRYRAATYQNLAKTRKAKRQNRTEAVTQRTAPPAPPAIQSVDLISPAAGKVLAVKAEQGQNLAAGQSIFFILPDDKTQPEDRWIQAWFPAKDRKRLKTGQKASIRFESLDLHLTGKVAEIYPEDQPLPLDTGAQTNAPKDYVAVKISLADIAEAEKLPPGIQATCQIQTRYSFGLPF